MPLPNRLAIYLGAAAAFLGALAPIVADLDFASTAGIVTAVAAITGLIIKWLSGWQAYEQTLGATFPWDEAGDEDFDPEAATVPPEAVEAAHAPIPGEPRGTDQ